MANSVMPDLIRYPVPFWIAQKLHRVSRPRLNTIPGQARRNDGRRVINRRRNNKTEEFLSGPQHSKITLFFHNIFYIIEKTPFKIL